MKRLFKNLQLVNDFLLYLNCNSSFLTFLPVTNNAVSKRALEAPQIIAYNGVTEIPTDCKEYGVFHPARVVEVSVDQPRIHVYEHFLSDEECEYIVNYGIQKGLSRSMVASEKNIESEVRTSYGAFLTEFDPVLKRIEDRISMWTKLPPENGEPYYLLRYEVGQQYKPHFDYFDPAIPGMDKYIGASGQRIATCLIYLETPDEGGETYFPNAHPPLSVKAVKGTAVLFWSMTVDNKLDTYSLHGSAPVSKGTKYCMTKWFRENSWRQK